MEESGLGGVGCDVGRGGYETRGMWDGGMGQDGLGIEDVRIPLYTPQACETNK